MDDSNFRGVLTYGDFRMSKTLYPHEWVAAIICNIANRHPEMFRSFCYIIFPILVLTFEVVLANHINVDVNINNLSTIQNQFLIYVGLNLSSIITIILLAIGIIEIWESNFNG